ncbi:Malectin-like carbohydrate-binding domain containing protein [Trema orientale]|uniref:Malectin-like carbohydrate-binding domain containing protein n=1 Tax=Trema orientale TaxID=63057 RepID=A0A2P5FHL5_TREOI|nr:Malectin-like carbohydrate-binding domain containing protein [Trema orientale]
MPLAEPFFFTNELTIATRDLVGFGSINEVPVPVYINVYFSEVYNDLNPSKRRRFQIYIDDVPYLDAIIPPNGSVTQVTIIGINVSHKTYVVLKGTPDSNLPPSINAIEVYRVSGTPNYGPVTVKTSDGSRLDLLVRAIEELRLSSPVRVQFANLSFNSLSPSTTSSDSLNPITAESLPTSSQALSHGPRPSRPQPSQALSPLV